MKPFKEYKQNPHTNTYQKRLSRVVEKHHFFAAVKRCLEFEQFARDFKKPHNPFYMSFALFKLLSQTHHVFPEKPMKSGYYSQSNRSWNITSVTKLAAPHALFLAQHAFPLSQSGAQREKQRTLQQLSVRTGAGSDQYKYCLYFE